MENLNNHESDTPEFQLDAEAFTKAFEEFHPQMVAYGKALSHDRDTAEDYVGDVLERAWKNRANIKKEDKVQSYLLVSVRNAHIDATKRDKIASRAYDEFLREIPNPDPDDPQDIIEHQELYIAFENAVDNLPDKQPDIARKRLIDNLSPEEAQSIIEDGADLSALNSRLYRARLNLQKNLKDWLI